MLPHRSLLLLAGLCVASPRPSCAKIGGCNSANPLGGAAGCYCAWAKDQTDHSTFAGLCKPSRFGAAEIAATGLPAAVVKGANDSPQACERVCCQARLITDAPAAAQAPAQSGPCGMWQWTEGSGTGDGCWLGLDNTKRTPPLPQVGTGSETWVGGSGNLGKSTTNWGWTLILLLGAAAGCYVGGGVQLGRRGGSMGGIAAHPHYRRWLELSGMAVDGIRYSTGGALLPPGGGTRGGSGSGAGSAAASAGKSQQQQQHGSGSPKGDSRSKGTKEKKKGKRRDKASSSSGGKASSSGSTDEPLLAEVAAKKTAAAGDGGRWVHVAD